ncbi:hypothetical protein [Neisseria animaloris]|uniref:hypothetical protein n=1 Tax=Neisseria animaloris TaxID=326522 RepID=UPI000D3143F5|nr:hypothetical protein [Neisseria animaloris]
MKIKVAKENLVVIDRTESLLASILKDVMTLIMLAFCVYIGRESTWWTFVSGLMFILFLSARLSAIYRERVIKFKTWAEFKAWVDMQSEEIEG